MLFHNIRNPPNAAEGFWFEPIHTPLKFLFSFILPFKNYGFKDPFPSEFPVIFLDGYRYFLELHNLRSEGWGGGLNSIINECVRNSDKC